MKNRGQVQLVYVIVGGAFTLLASVGGAWVSGSSAASDQLNDSRLETQKEFGADRQRISTLEEAIKMMKDSQTEMRNDIKELLSRTPKK